MSKAEVSKGKMSKGDLTKSPSINLADMLGRSNLDYLGPRPRKKSVKFEKNGSKNFEFGYMVNIFKHFDYYPITSWPFIQISKCPKNQLFIT